MVRFVISSGVALMASAGLVAPSHAATTVVPTSCTLASTCVGVGTGATIDDFSTRVNNGTKPKNPNIGAAYIFGDIYTPDVAGDNLPGFKETFFAQKSQENRLAVRVDITPGLGGMDGKYLSIGNGTSNYTITFDTAIQVFSFAYNNFDSSAYVELTTALGTTKYSGSMLAGLLGSSFNPNYGRLTFDFHGGSGLLAAKFVAGNGILGIDSITGAAPEPATWGMMIIGFGLAGAQLRSRKRKVKLAAA